VTDADTSDVSWDEARQVYATRFDENGRSPSVAVAEALAAAFGETTRPLFDYVDPDALDDVVAGPAASPSVVVTFRVEETLVTVRGDGRVSVRP
jgi:hypothetical protein